MTRKILRLIAFAIAAAGVVDPAIPVSGASRARVAIVAADPASFAARDVAARLSRALSSSYEITPTVTSDAAAAVVIGERYPDDPPPDSLLVSTVTTPAATTQGARIVGVDAPRDVPPATAIPLGVDVLGGEAAGQTTDISATIGNVEIGRASHRWLAGEARWRARIEAIPVGDPPYAVRVAAGTSVADVVVDSRRAPLRVEFYDPRPSWATTFLRRALEADARFQVAALTFTSRGIAARTGGAVPPGDPGLDAFDVVIAGGLDRLSAADAGALERFMRERGGAVVLVPDQRIEAGPARDLASVPPPVERLVEQPAKLAVSVPGGSLQASEMLVVPLTPAADALAWVPGSDGSARSGSPVIVSMPRGDGRLVLSGAMDAWRFRGADNDAFDRFWRSTIAGLALAVPPPIAIDVEPPVLRPGASGHVVVRVRAVSVTAVSASIDRDQPIRLLPQPETGVYRGRFTAKRDAGRSTLEVVADGAEPSSASRTVLIRPDASPLRSGAAPSLSMLAASHRGIDVTPDRLSDLERFLRTAVGSPRATRVRHPMRSTWWMLPFAACLSAEWWIRRRRGLR